MLKPVIALTTLMSITIACKTTRTPEAQTEEVSEVSATPEPVEESNQGPETTKFFGDNQHPYALELKATIEYPPYQEWLKQKCATAFPGFSLTAQIEKWKTEHPDITVGQMAMNLGVLEQCGKSALGFLHPKICAAASGHADYMARTRRQSHDGYGPRIGQFGQASEIVKETFDGEQASILKAGRFCGNWTSGTHRPDMMGAHKSFCYDMRMIPNGKWYCVGIFSETY